VDNFGAVNLGGIFELEEDKKACLDLVLGVTKEETFKNRYLRSILEVDLQDYGPKASEPSAFTSSSASEKAEAAKRLRDYSTTLRLKKIYQSSLEQVIDASYQMEFFISLEAFIRYFSAKKDLLARNSPFETPPTPQATSQPQQQQQTYQRPTTPEQKAQLDAQANRSRLSLESADRDFKGFMNKHANLFVIHYIPVAKVSRGIVSFDRAFNETPTKSQFLALLNGGDLFTSSPKGFVNLEAYFLCGHHYLEKRVTYLLELLCGSFVGRGSEPVIKYKQYEKTTPSSTQSQSTSNEASISVRDKVQDTVFFTTFLDRFSSCLKRSISPFLFDGVGAGNLLEDPFLNFLKYYYPINYNTFNFVISQYTKEIEEKAELQQCSLKLDVEKALCENRINDVNAKCKAPCPLLVATPSAPPAPQDQSLTKTLSLGGGGGSRGGAASEAATRLPATAAGMVALQQLAQAAAERGSV
jgi:hypothetical protein